MTITGFDLDMTLIDSRPGIKAVYDQLSAETGVVIDSALAVSRLGPPVAHELAHWFDESVVEEMAGRYRALYPSIAVEHTELLPGARSALAIAAEAGEVLIITAKLTSNARLHVEHLRLEVDALFGDVWRAGKADILLHQGADVYVGDHVHDMEAASLAGAVGIGVATGPCGVDELQAAGATAVIRTLDEFSLEK